MADVRTQQTLDELAELFLTQLADEQGAESQPQNVSTGTTTATPSQRGMSAKTTPLHGPGPMRMSPKPARGRTGSQSRPQPPNPPQHSSSAASQGTQSKSDTGNSTSSAPPFLRYTGDRAGEILPSNGYQPDKAPGEPDEQDRWGQSQAEQTATHADGPLHVEAVLLGNLPGMAGAWLSQYAQIVADREDSGVALLSLNQPEADLVNDQTSTDSQPQQSIPNSQGMLDLSLVRPSRHSLQSRAGERGRGQSNHGGDHGQDQNQPTRTDNEHDPPSHCLTEAIRGLVQADDPHVGTVLIHLPGSNQPLAGRWLEDVERWTLVCGAEETSVSSACSMVEHLRQHLTTPINHSLGLMMMGASQPRAADAAARIAMAVEDDIAGLIELSGSAQKMIPVHIEDLATFEHPADQWSNFVHWLGGTNPGEAHRPGPQAGHESPAHLQQEPPTEETPMSEAHDVPVDDRHMAFTNPSEEEEALAEEAEALATNGRARSSTETIRDWWEDRPRFSSRAEAEGPTRFAGSPTFATAVSPDFEEPVPGLTHLLTSGPRAMSRGVALEARCPHQPRIELMIDDEGRLHLLRRDEPEHEANRPQSENGRGTWPDGVGMGRSSTALREAIVDLIEGRKWVVEHLELLQLTCRDLAFDTNAAPALHLFTDRAALATGLVHRIGADLKLHLLQRIRVGDQLAWFSTPLN